ncbi:MAG: MFS transporter [Micromonosporaceae bacterium]|nr:MFS transporter [Micromonosporaceae bacterium]
MFKTRRGPAARVGGVTTLAPGRRAVPLLTVLLVGQAMASMDGSIVAVAIPTIRHTLGAGDAAIQLTLAGYTLAFGVLVVTGARLGDRLGHATAFRLGLAGFTLASLACGLAPDPATLVVARIVQGATGALMVPQVLSMIQLSFQGARRARAIGLYSMVLALGVAAGQLVGGLVVALDLGGLAWRPAFLLNLPVGVVLLVASRRHLPPRTAGAAATRLDLVGVGLLSAAMLAAVLPVVIGREQGWPAWAMGGSLLVAAVGLVSFRWYEHRLAGRGGAPLVELTALRPAGVRPGLVAGFLIMGCYAAYLFALMLHLQDGLGFGPLAAGLTFLPYPAGFALVSLGEQRLPARLRAALPVAGPLLFAGAIGLLALAVLGAGSGGWPAVLDPGGRGWPAVLAVPLLLLAGAGHAAGFTPLFARVLSWVEPRYAATLSGMGSTGSLLAGVFGVAAVGSVYLAVADAPGRSAAGLIAVTAVVIGLLLVGAGCARRVRSVRPD